MNTLEALFLTLAWFIEVNLSKPYYTWVTISGDQVSLYLTETCVVTLAHAEHPCDGLCVFVCMHA